MPTEEVLRGGKWYIQGCMPDYRNHRTFGGNIYDTAFGKNILRNKSSLATLVQIQMIKD